ncbi:MAG TPA: hypothetical protein VF839_01160 [Clostridium sp.]
MGDNTELNIGNTDSNGSVSVCCTGDPTCAHVTTKPVNITEQLDVLPTILTPQPVYVKLPVVLAETSITIPVEAIITLDRDVTEIKRIKKNVYLTQSRLLPNTSTDPTTNTNAILFVAGFIRKNIEYATQTCPIRNGLAVASSNYCGEIRHCTVEDCFSFTTRVTLLNTPQFVENTTPLEFGYFTDKLRGCDICADPVLGRNPCEQIFDFTETFNEKPYVELISARVIEVDIHKNPDRDCCTPTEQLFDRFTEKAVVYLTLKVLQKQQLVVNAVNANGTGTPGTTVG